MSDLISRQAAIDAMEESKTIFHDRRIIIGKMQDIVNNLPSVQPEIIRCQECKYASPNGEYGCRAYHYKLYEKHEMKADDFCSRAERRNNG